MKTLLFVFLLGFALLWVGCGGWAQVRAEHEAAVKQRASFDLNCKPESLTLTPLLGNKDIYYEQYGVTGCGQKAVYVNAARMKSDTPGNWVLNSESKPAQ